jgi:hypothetical protein
MLGAGGGVSARRIAATALAVVLLAAPSASAQTFQFGVKGGVNFATLSVEDGDSAFDSRIGAVIGGFVTWQAFSWLELQPEVLFSSKGAKVEESGISSNLIVDYLEMPILARYSRPLSDNWRIYVAGGPTLGVRLRARATTEFSGGTEEIDIDDDVEQMDFGVAVGGGVEVGRWMFDGRYTFGLSDIDANASDAATFRNRAISVTAGFRF